MFVLLDTNIIIEHLQSNTLKTVSDEIFFAVSVISETELLRFAGMMDIEEKMIDEFLSITQKFSVDSRIARRAAVIGRTRKTKLPDLLIAATALEWNIPLITKNLRDFRNIPNLIVKTNLN